MTVLHVIPSNDLREHPADRRCWCKPIEDDFGVWTHNAMDQRELVEQGKRAVQ